MSWARARASHRDSLRARALPTLRAVFGFDIAGAITQLRQPIHAINATRHPTLLEINRRYAPRFEVTLMDGVGHFPMIEDPKRFNRILAQTVAGFGGTP